MYTVLRFWLPLASAIIVAAIPLARHYRMSAAEAAAAETLAIIARAQNQFRGSGREGYAVEWASLFTPCNVPPTPLIEPDLADKLAQKHGYRLSLRAATAAMVLGADCRGHALVSDYYVSVEPLRVGVDGRRALAATSMGRIYAFPDGVAPRENDMAEGGLALPLETLETFKIP